MDEQSLSFRLLAILFPIFGIVAAGIAILMIPTVPQLGAALQGVYQRIQTQVTSIGTTP